MKKYLVISLFVLLSFSFKNQVLADAGPPTPDYPSIELNVKVGLGNLADKYVIIQRNSRFGEYYDLVTNPFVSPDGYGMNTYFAMDKDYFESKGGIKGLFSTTGSDENATMFPKDSNGFKIHSHNFIISKNDQLLDSKFGNRAIETVDNQYIKFPFRFDFYVRQGPDDSDCETGFNSGAKNCITEEKTLVYLPQQLYGNNIILIESEDLSQPLAQQPSSQNIQSENVTSVQPPEVSVLPQYIPWYEKILIFIKSLF